MPAGALRLLQDQVCLGQVVSRWVTPSLSSGMSGPVSVTLLRVRSEEMCPLRKGSLPSNASDSLESGGVSVNRGTQTAANHGSL